LCKSVNVLKKKSLVTRFSTFGFKSDRYLWTLFNKLKPLRIRLRICKDIGQNRSILRGIHSTNLYNCIYDIHTLHFGFNKALFLCQLSCWYKMISLTSQIQLVPFMKCGMSFDISEVCIHAERVCLLLKFLFYVKFFYFRLSA
jgi:hypothetical protein